ncbi:restriction endonuclease subunit S [Bacteroides xylanisolvens]|nr:restriction endonuclease subunit S [Bacteroides xylanisolvens]
MTKYRFDEIAINSTQKKKPTEEDKVYYIGLEHIDPGCFDVVRWGSDIAPTGDKLLMQKGDVLFGKRRAYQRKVAIAPFDGIFSAHGMVLRPNLKVIDANYFPFFISSDKFMDVAIRISVGGLSPTINWKDLAKQEFELPSLEEQKVLADKLWAAYRLKQAYKKLLAATDEMVKSQFIEMFGDQNTNDKQWAESLVKDEFKLSMGKTPARSNPECWENGTHKWISISDMAIYTRYTGDTSEYITDYAITDSGIKVVPKGTIIMSFKLSIGRTAITSEDIYTNEAIMAFTDFDKKKFNIDFLHFLIANKNWLLGAKQAVKGQTLNKESIGNAKIVIPPIALQEEFAQIYNQADKSKFELKQCIENIDKVIKSLING